MNLVDLFAIIPFFLDLIIGGLQVRLHHHVALDNTEAEREPTKPLTYSQAIKIKNLAIVKKTFFSSSFLLCLSLTHHLISETESSSKYTIILTLYFSYMEHTSKGIIIT